MDCIYLFSTNQISNQTVLADALNNIIPGIEVFFDSEYSGYFVADSACFAELNSRLYEVQSELNDRISVLVAHKKDDLSARCLRDALAFFPNQCTFISDILFKQFSFGNFSSLHYLKAQFKELSPELLETVGAYLRCGMDGLGSAKYLNIHRNTFNYRLKEFIRITNLDIRDYHNALLLEIYFQYCK